MNAEKMMAVIKALPKCEYHGDNCKNHATQVYRYYESNTLICDFHAREYVIKDPLNTGKFKPDPNISDLPYAAELRELFVFVVVPVIHDDTPII